MISTGMHRREPTVNNGGRPMNNSYDPRMIDNNNNAARHQECDDECDDEEPEEDNAGLQDECMEECSSDDESDNDSD